jgi:hypothetical protein
MLRDPLRAATQARFVTRGWLLQWVVSLTTLFGLIPSHIASAQDNATPAALSTEQVEFFEKKIRPILVERCYECHSGSESNGGLRFDDRDRVRRGGDTGPAIVEGEPDASLMIRAVRYTNADLQMPPSGRLPDDEIATLEQWVAAGAFDPREPVSDTPAPLTGMSIDAGRAFWSMLPLSDPAIPTVEYADWVSNPIDSFILAKLESQGLIPAPPASRRDWLRRLWLNLTGVPPTVEEWQLFEQDTAPGAHERAIDRCMSSPQYGVRFGRHWLDVARYADSNGLDENIAYGNAWRYRDYVIGSFNADKPFDRFVEEQIAGDLLPDADRESTTGTGFLVLGAKVLAEPDREKLVMDTIDEQLDSLGKSFMGMTLGCARCHDHKFDPIKQRDYYAMAAIFKGTKTFGDTNFGAIKHWNEVSYATNEEREKLKQVDADIAKKQGAFNSAKGAAMQQLRDRVRSQAASYLAIAAMLPPEATLTQWSEAGKGEGLHPRVLSHCRKHLEFHREDPIFEPWHAMAAQGDIDGIRRHYETLFNSVKTAWDEAKKADSNTSKLPDAAMESVRLALQEPGGFLAIPAKMEHALDEETIAKLHALADEARIFESAAPDTTSVMGVADRDVVDGIPLHIRGSHRQLGERIDKGFPEVMRDPHRKPIFSRRGSGRLELARWLASPEHPLTARVIVNRVWRWHFGRGLVASTENFGQLGDRPSHPELLDYLARWFIESGWSIKELNRLILTSSTYQMQSHHEWPVRALTVDPENTLLWRFRMQRMDAEQARDSILACAGVLDLQMGGKSVPLRNRQFVFDHTSIDHTRYESVRRTVFLPVIRNHLFTLLEQFDFPDPTMPGGDRQTTTVAPQALLLMNADWVLDAASTLARQSEQAASLPADRIDWLMMQTVGRPPNEREREVYLRFVSEPSVPVVDPTSATSPSTTSSLSTTRWEMLAHNLLICNEFFYIQ